MLNTISVLVWSVLSLFCVLLSFLYTVEHSALLKTRPEEPHHAVDEIITFTARFEKVRYPGYEYNWSSVNSEIIKFLESIDYTSEFQNRYSYQYYSFDTIGMHKDTFTSTSNIGGYVISIQPTRLDLNKRYESICLFSHIDSSSNSYGYSNDIYGLSESLLLIQDFINFHDLQNPLYFILLDSVLDGYESYYAIQNVDELSMCMLSYLLNSLGGSDTKPYLLSTKGSMNLFEPLFSSPQSYLKISNYLLDYSSLISSQTGSDVFYENFFKSSANTKGVIEVGYADFGSNRNTPLDQYATITNDALESRYEFLYQTIMHLGSMDRHSFKELVEAPPRAYSFLPFLSRTVMVSSDYLCLSLPLLLLFVLFLLIHMFNSFIRYNYNEYKDKYTTNSPLLEFVQLIKTSVRYYTMIVSGILLTFLLNSFLVYTNVFGNTVYIQLGYILLLVISSVAISLMILRYFMNQLFLVHSKIYHFAHFSMIYFIHLFILLCLQLCHFAITVNLFCPSLLSVFTMGLLYAKFITKENESDQHLSYFTEICLFCLFLFISISNMISFVYTAEVLSPFLINSTYRYTSLFVSVLACYSAIFSMLYYLYLLYSLYPPRRRFILAEYKQVLISDLYYYQSHYQIVFKEKQLKDLKNHFLSLLLYLICLLLVAYWILFGIIALISNPRTSQNHLFHLSLIHQYELFKYDSLDIKSLFQKHHNNLELYYEFQSLLSANSAFNEEDVDEYFINYIHTLKSDLYNNNNDNIFYSSYMNYQSYLYEDKTSILLSTASVYFPFNFFNTNLMLQDMFIHQFSPTQCFPGTIFQYCYLLDVYKHNQNAILSINEDIFPITRIAIFKLKSKSLSHDSSSMDLLQRVYEFFRSPSSAWNSTNKIVTVLNMPKPSFTDILGNPFSYLSIDCKHDYLSSLDITVQWNQQSFSYHGCHLHGFMKHMNQNVTYTITIEGKQKTSISLLYMDQIRVHSSETYSIMEGFQQSFQEYYTFFYPGNQIHMLRKDFQL